MSDFEVQETELKKRFLKRYKKNLALIERLKSKVAVLDDRRKTIRSPKLSDMPRGGVPVTAEDLLAEQSEIEDRIKRLECKSKRLKSEILNKIDEVEDYRYAEILEAYFIECKDFDSIADDMNYNIRHIMRLYTEAVNAIELE